MKKLLYGIVMGLIAAWSVACANVAPTPARPSPGGAISDTVSLVEKLRATGKRVEPGEEISQPFFTVKGRIVKFENHDLQIFEYATESAAQADAARVSPDGRAIGTTMVSWMATPHFYRVNRLIVLYVGDDQTILATLEAALGAQFAGGKTAQLPRPTLPNPCAAQAGTTIQYLNAPAGYCLTYPARFKISANDPANVTITGPGIGAGPEPVHASLNIARVGPAHGRTLAQVVDQVINENKNLQIKRTRGALANVDAEIVEGLPGRTGSRQMFVIYKGQIYHWILQPVDEAFPQVHADVNEVWATVTRSFAFSE